MITRVRVGPALQHVAGLRDDINVDMAGLPVGLSYVGIALDIDYS